MDKWHAINFLNRSIFHVAFVRHTIESHHVFIHATFAGWIHYQCALCNFRARNWFIRFNCIYMCVCVWILSRLRLHSTMFTNKLVLHTVQCVNKLRSSIEMSRHIFTYRKTYRLYTRATHTQTARHCTVVTETHRIEGRWILSSVYSL